MATDCLPVYLIHYDRPAWCASAVQSLLATEGVDVDLTVVDNGQTSPPPLSDCLPGSIRVLAMATNAGYTGAANAALADWRARHAEGEFCLIGSHDLHVEPFTLSRLLQAAATHPDAGILAPVLVAPRPATGGVWMGRYPRQFGSPVGPGVVERDWVSGTAMVLRRGCVDSVGSFDERLGSYVEDVDYGLRARDHGWKVLIVSEARARGMGSVTPDPKGLIAANIVLLNAKRSGKGAALVTFAQYGAKVVRGYVGSALPWRQQERRRRSRTWARSTASGLAHLVTDGRLWAALRTPGDGGGP